MPRYIAFLRAINVGGHYVTMDRLRQLFEGLGFSPVETFIASGNVIFDAPARSARTLEKKIEQHLEQGLGYAVATFLRTPAEVAAIAQRQPFPQAELEVKGNVLYVAFLGATPSSAAQQTVLALRSAVDDFHFHERELYWLRRSGEGESAASGAVFEKKLGAPATVRNLTTVRRLAAKYAPAARA